MIMNKTEINGCGDDCIVEYDWFIDEHPFSSIDEMFCDYEEYDDGRDEYTEWFWNVYGNDVYDDYDEWFRDSYGYEIYESDVF